MRPDLYKDYFHFTERPFSLLPDPDFLFWSQAHTRAFSILEYGLVTRAPLTVVTGEVEDPAVVVPDDSPVEPVADWTYRYLIPSTLALAAVIILGTSIRYFTNVVRQRYRTVEE